MENFKKWGEQVCGKVCEQLKNVAVEKYVENCLEMCSLLGNLESDKIMVTTCFTQFSTA